MKKKISLITAGILLIAAVAFFAFNEIGMYIAVGGKYFRSFLLETAVYSFPPFVMVSFGKRPTTEVRISPPFAAD